MTPDQRRRRQGRPDNQGTPLTISPLTPSVDLNPEIATGLLKFHSIASLDGVTIDLGGKVYTFDASLLNINGHVHIETDVPTTLSNLLAAMSLGPGSGTKYAAVMTEHPNMDAALGALIAATGVLTLTSNAVAGNTVTIDGKVYTFRDNIEVKATGILTLTALPLDGNTVTIDGKVYTFESDISAQSDGLVDIGTDADESLSNLIAAITLGAGSGTAYGSSMTLHPTVSAVEGAGDTMDAEAKAAGVGGNSIATIATLSGGSWGATELAGGEGAANGDVLVGSVATDSIDNLIAAILLGAGGGTAYANAMSVHPTVTAVDGPSTTMDITAKTPGAAGNALATIATLAGGSWAAATLTKGADTGDISAKVAGAAGNALVQLTGNNNLIDFDDTVLSGGADAGGSLQMVQVRTLFGKDVSDRGGYPAWVSADPNLFTVSQPNDADGDGVVEDKGGLVSGVGVQDGAAEVSAEFPGVTPVATLVTLT